MKKIIISLGVIGVISAAVITGTVAYFSDTEVVAGNTFSAGTIDISLDNTVTIPGTLEGMNPGETRYIEFDIHNDGTDPVVLRKKIDGFVRDGGNPSEPECLAESGSWDSSTSVCTGGVAIDNIDAVTIYDMELKFGTSDPIVLISDNWGVTLADVDSLWIPIGTLEVGETVHVKQSYHFSPLAGNEYQGDSLAFDINIYAEQGLGEGPATTRGVVMENKSGNPDWYQVLDGTWGILTYAPSAPTFDYNFKGFGLDPALTYRLVYWNGTSEVEISTPTPPNSGGELTLSGSKELATGITNGKIWLRPVPWTSTSDVETLWEGNLVSYDDTNN